VAEATSPLPAGPNVVCWTVPAVIPFTTTPALARLSRSSWNFGDDGPGVDRYIVTVIAASWFVDGLGW
jgi:hypothetical protein